MPPLDSKLAQTVQLLYIAMCGNKEMDPDDKGIIGKIEDMHERLEDLETLKTRIKDKFTYLMIGLSIPAGFGITEILSIIAGWLKHAIK